MADAIVAILARHGYIVQDELALEFAQRYRSDPHRRYALTDRRILTAISNGVHWKVAAANVNDGAGSMGNGAAMRVAPIGAYYADSLETVAEQARLSAATTHAHSEAQAGAIAVAVAAALAARRPAKLDHGRRLLETAYELTPPGDTRTGLAQALILGRDASVASAAESLGNGERLNAADTVPFALWCAARHIHDFTEALWTVASAGGDSDTNAAIVGAIVALANHQGAIPASWINAREPLKSA
jgi:ADP-ribosylglycohydrolase